MAARWFLSHQLVPCVNRLIDLTLGWSETIVCRIRVSKMWGITSAFLSCTIFHLAVTSLFSYTSTSLFCTLFSSHYTLFRNQNARVHRINRMAGVLRACVWGRLPNEGEHGKKKKYMRQQQYQRAVTFEFKWWLDSMEWTTAERVNNASNSWDHRTRFKRTIYMLNVKPKCVRFFCVANTFNLWLATTIRR